MTKKKEPEILLWRTYAAEEVAEIVGWKPEPVIDARDPAAFAADWEQGGSSGG